MTFETRTVPLAALTESPSNPRKLFGNLAELAESLKLQGMLQPILARPLGKGFEVVVGHRRFRAAKLAGLKEVPVVVRQMGDVEVIEAQLTENLQRADVHPLELAGGYAALVAKGFKAEQIADRLGVSRSSVFAVVKLLDLSEPLQKAFLAGKFGQRSALAIARVRGDLRQKQAADVVERLGGPDARVRDVEKELTKRFGDDRKVRGVAAQRRKAAVTVVDQAPFAKAMLNRAAEAVARKAYLDDADLRVLLLGLTASDDGALERLLEAGAKPEKLAKARGAELRALLLRVVLGPWLLEPAARATVAKVYGLDLKEIEKTAQALAAAEKLMG